MTTPEKDFIIDRKNLIDQIHEEISEIQSIFEDIERNLSIYTKYVDADHYSDTCLKCHYCELDMFKEVLCVFDERYSMSDCDPQIDILSENRDAGDEE
jgi:hypothetical protein